MSPHVCRPAGVAVRPGPRRRIFGVNGEAQSHGRGVSHVQFLPGGGQLLSSGLDGRLSLWDVATGRNTLVRESRMFAPLSCRFTFIKQGANTSPSVSLFPSVATLFYTPTTLRCGSTPSDPASLFGDFRVCLQRAMPHVAQSCRCSRQAGQLCGNIWPNTGCPHLNLATSKASLFQAVFTAGMDASIVVPCPARLG